MPVFLWQDSGETVLPDSSVAREFSDTKHPTTSSLNRNFSLLPKPAVKENVDFAVSCVWRIRLR